MADAHKNFSYSLVATAPSPATSGTSLVVTTGDGTKFPTPPFNATIWPTGSNPLSSNAEIVRVTAIATDTLTITRAQESSSARTVVVGDQIAATVTAKTLTDVEIGYRPKSYGAVGNGSTDDATAFQAAIDAANAAGGGMVFCDGLTYALGSAVTIKQGVELVGTATTIWKFTANTNGFVMNAESRIRGGAIAINSSSYTSNAVYFEGAQQIRDGKTSITGTHIYNWSGVMGGNGIRMSASTTNGYIQLVNITDVHIRAFAKGVYITVTDPGGGNTAWVNGNRFDNLTVEDCISSIEMSSAGAIPNEASGNIFSNLQIQCDVATTSILKVSGGGNLFDGFAWDIPSTATYVTFLASSNHNRVQLQNITTDMVSNLGTATNWIDGEVRTLPLYIANSASASTLEFASADGFSAGLNVQKKGHTGSATAATQNEIGYHSFYGWTGSASKRLAYVVVYADGTTAAGTGGGKYIINVRDNTTNVENEAVQVLGTGDVRFPLPGGHTNSAVTVGGAQTLTGKTFNWASNTVSMTTAQLNTALSDNDIATLAGTETLTNKRVTPRVNTTTSSATPTINTDTTDHFTITALAVNITSMTTNLSGTPTENQALNIAITGTAARTIAWGTSFENGPTTLPTTTVTTQRLDVSFRWNSVTSKWRCMASGSA